MLYTARLQLIDTKHVVVVGGTAFGEIVVWVYRDEEPSDLVPYESKGVEMVFQAHEGSVFGVDVVRPVSSKVDADDLEIFIVSCSDDRTIRLWGISNGNENDRNCPTEEATVVDLAPLHKGPQGRCTYQKNSSAFCIAKVMAHVSRIWCVSFVPGMSSSDKVSRNIHIITAGEDSTSQLFRLKPDISGVRDVPLIHKLQRIQTYSNHSGKNIWSLAKKRGHEDHLHLATGGGDSSCNIEDLRGAIDGHAQHVEGEWSPRDVLLEIEAVTPASCHNVQKHGPHMLQISKCGLARGHSVTGNQSIGTDVRDPNDYWARDRFSAYAFVSSKSLLVTTHDGRVLHGRVCSVAQCLSLEKEVNVHWSHVGGSRSLTSYSLVSGVSAAGVAFFAASTGEVLCFIEQTRRTMEIAHANGKVIKMLAQDVTDPIHLKSHEVPTQGRISSKHIILFYKTDRSMYGRLNFFEISMTGEIEETDKMLVEINCEIPVTSILVVGPFEEDYLLFVGFRSGEVARYTFAKCSDDNVPQGKRSPVLRAESCSAHHQDAVTSLAWLKAHSNNTMYSQRGFIYVLTTSRDSTYAIHSHQYYRTPTLKFQKNPKLLHRTTLPFGSNIEGAYFQSKSPQTTSQEELIFYGFRGTKFVAYNESTRQEVLCVEAGGAHRVWAFQPGSTANLGDNRSIFAWTKASRLHVAIAAPPQGTRIKNGGHGREITACAIRPSLKDSESGKKRSVLATGAEDTEIRLFSYMLRDSSNGSAELRCERVIKGHNTGIRSLQWSRDGKFLFSCGGCEEFFVWRIRFLPIIEFGVVRQSALATQSELPDLRIMGFEVLKMAMNTDANDSDGRDAEEERATAFWICMGFSNSTIRVSIARSSEARFCNP